VCVYVCMCVCCNISGAPLLLPNGTPSLCIKMCLRVRACVRVCVCVGLFV